MVTSSLRQRGLKVAGGLVAASIAAAWLFAGIVCGIVNRDLMIAALALLAPPVLIVFILGRRLAREATTSERGIWATIVLALLTVVVNSYAVTLELAVSYAISPRTEYSPNYDLVGFIGAALLEGLLGVIYVGWIAIWPALGSAAVWTLAMRHLFPRATQ